LVPITRSSVRYVATAPQDAELVSELRVIAGKHPRFGDRRAHALVVRGGKSVNHKRVARLWSVNNLTLPRRQSRPRQRVEPVTPLAQATRPNEVWTYDFVHDGCANGEQLKMLTVIDEYTRESLAIETRTSMKSQAVIEVLNRLQQERGAPAFLRSDTGAEFTARRVQSWLTDNHIQTLYIEPGSRWQNSFGESFNGRLRDECLNSERFGNAREAKVIVESWRKHYNEERPHSSLQYQTPVEFRLAISKAKAVLHH
jgi:putative transposase